MRWLAGDSANASYSVTLHIVLLPPMFFLFGMQTTLDNLITYSGATCCCFVYVNATRGFFAKKVDVT